ncbi:hypothetical protein [Tropicibacter naphthalenivorans]|uniref:Uncharacterized protein n=1 Tax=Tropicibacter naphthalenivorans TaxID=441103 RepID=A0A0P1G890_9RHOB|nr:hypothetical protein [Tropicibacter naphthalenivorans]CUH77859.1 hypothetical protein TRN7648_01657 [Tropicibacter naphthalenivorans]SMC95363.1 hypothetical protein SAMN04488093_107184 [Tropicibacter naphthalenivorans]
MILDIFKEKNLLALALCFWGGALAAEDIRPGCYERVYTEDHLRSHPEQVVWQIRLKVGDWFTEVSREGKLEVVAANQGHARSNDMMGRVLEQSLYCGTETRGDVCQAECDAGRLEVIKQDSSGMIFRTRFLLVGEDGCDGLMDLAEVRDQWVSYRLNRVSASVCSGM